MTMVRLAKSTDSDAKGYAGSRHSLFGLPTGLKRVKLDDLIAMAVVGGSPRGHHHPGIPVELCRITFR